MNKPTTRVRIDQKESVDLLNMPPDSPLAVLKVKGNIRSIEYATPMRPIDDDVYIDQVEDSLSF